MSQRPIGSDKSDRATTRKPPPNYLSRREQMRLLVLVGMLMLVIILMMEASKPKNWEWMWAQQPQGLTEAEITNKEIDTRLAPQAAPERTLAPDEFISPLPETPANGTGQDQRDEYFPGVDPQLLATVRDDMLLIPAESEAWYHLWVVLKNADAEQLEAASVGRKGFVQLYEQAKEYRGRLVTIRGEVRQAFQIKAHQNDYGIEGYWECWLRPAGGPNSPIIVYSLEMPSGFPSGTDVREEVTFTGFSYKRKAYQARGKSGTGETRTAPLVMAKIGQWTPPVEEETRSASVGAIVVAVIGTALMAVAVAMFVYFRSGAVGNVTAQYHLTGRAKPSEFEGLAKTDLGPGVSENLNQIAADQDRGNV
jgi:hypothetical protein